MRKFLSFIAVASLSVCAFAQEANVASPSDLTVTSQPASVVEPTPVVEMPVMADQTVMMSVMPASNCGCNGMYTSAPVAATGCSSCATSVSVAPACSTCNTGCNTNTRGLRGVYARTPILNRSNNNCCQSVSVAPACNTCGTYTAAPVAQDCGCNSVVSAPISNCGCSAPVSNCCQPAVNDCCQPNRVRVLRSQPVRTRLLSRRGNNCGC